MTPSVGRIVHYVLPDGRNRGTHRPALIVAVWSETIVNLQVFTDGPNDGNDYVTGQVWRTSVRFAEEGDFGTWHWPERPSSGDVYPEAP